MAPGHGYGIAEPREASNGGSVGKPTRRIVTSVGPAALHAYRRRKSDPSLCGFQETELGSGNEDPGRKSDHGVRRQCALANMVDYSA